MKPHAPALPSLSFSHKYTHNCDPTNPLCLTFSSSRLSKVPQGVRIVGLCKRSRLECLPLRVAFLYNVQGIVAREPLAAERKLVLALALWHLCEREGVGDSGGDTSQKEFTRKRGEKVDEKDRKAQFE